jgi:2-polyprenyl-3-methyl-5-hydroxy-6-metoxy-1,4-benzoquinol methylase
MLSVKKFYDEIPFPGYYTIEQLRCYGNPIENQYLQKINSQINSQSKVLDAGCGTGLITNLLSIRNPTCHITGIDFANSIDYAKKFSKENNLNNVKFIKKNLIDYNFKNQFDIVICQGVLHHIPEYKQVLSNLLNAVAPNGKIILGLYHPAGKLLKKYVTINYGNDILYKDQEQNPFELSFTYKQVKELTIGWKITNAEPHILNNVSISAFFNYRNGGLVLYTLERDKK